MMAASLVFTFSRGAWIGFAIACGFYILLKDKRFVIPAIIVAVLLVVCVPSVGNRIAYMLSPEYIESSLRGGRLVRWMTGLRILSFYPIFGVGLGHFGGAVAMNHNLQFMIDCGYQRTFYMDNYFLKTAVESGIVGFTSFVILMYSVIINSYRTIRMSVKVGDKKTKELCIGIMSGLLGVIVHNWVENVFETPLMASVFWVFVGVIMAVWYVNRQKVKDVESSTSSSGSTDV
jgi:O-antigen ligase